MESHNKTFSVIIPTYRRARFLDSLLMDLEKQAFDKNKVEIIIISEEVDEATKNVIKKHMKKKVLDLLPIFFEKKLGLPAARNRGIEKARGKFLIFLDDDVRLEKDFLRACNKFSYLKNFCFRVIGRRSSILEKKLIGRVYPHFGLMFGGFGEKREKTIKVLHLVGACFIINKEEMGTLRFDEHLGGGNAYLEDCDFTYALSRKGCDLYYVSEHAIMHAPPAEGGCREIDYLKWIYYYWNHKAYFTKKHGGVFSLVAAFFVNLCECFYISFLKRKLFLHVFLRGWSDGIRKVHR